MSQHDIFNKIESISKQDNHKFNYICKYILNNLGATSEMVISELALKTYSSPATIHRFVKSIGLEGYRNLSIMLNNINQAKVGNDGVNVSEYDNESLNEVYITKINVVENNYDLLKQQINEIKEAAHLIVSSERIVFVAFGGTQNIARDFYNKLLRLGIICHISPDVHNVMFINKLLGENDLVFIISYSGYTTEILSMLDNMKKDKKRPKIVSLTKYVENPTMNRSDINIKITSEEGAFRITSWASRTAAFMALDTIFLEVINTNRVKYIEILKNTATKK